MQNRFTGKRRKHESTKSVAVVTVSAKQKCGKSNQGQKNHADLQLILKEWRDVVAFHSNQVRATQNHRRDKRDDRSQNFRGSSETLEFSQRNGRFRFRCPWKLVELTALLP